MYIYYVEIKGRKNSFLSEDKFNKNELVEQFIKGNDMAEFYEDSTKFIEEHCHINAQKATKKLYYITTNQGGYETYDSAVFCAYSEDQAIELSEEMMNDYYEYKNLARVIGLAEPHLEIGEVVSSFNAG